MNFPKSKFQEPYSPENTPEPPQIIDPRSHKGMDEDDRPVGNKLKGSKSGENRPPQKAQLKVKK